MRRLRSSGVRSFGFWFLVLAASANYAVNAAAAPLLTRGAQEILNQNAATAGGLVAMTGLTAMMAMALAGIVSDRTGPKTVAIVASIVAICGVGILILVFTIPSIAFSRLLYGIGNAGITVATTSWVALSTPAHERGRALGYYGISVWVGLALGPLLAENTYAWQGNQAAWMGMGLLQVLALALAMCVRGTKRPPSTDHTTLPLGPPPASTSSNSTPEVTASPSSVPSSRNLWASLARIVAVPASISLVTWGAQGLLTAFLIQHLEDQGVPASGTLGAASVFVIFAVSVVVARIAFGGVIDRIAAVKLTRVSLVFVAAGLAIIAFASGMGWAVVGAILLGIGYAPLYPTLTLMATAPLDERMRGTAIGIFSAATALGMALGPAIGGLAVTTIGSVGAFAIAACLQLAVLPVVHLAVPPRDAPNPHEE